MGDKKLVLVNRSGYELVFYITVASDGTTTVTIKPLDPELSAPTPPKS